jgi:hypothetical protein
MLAVTAWVVLELLQQQDRFYPPDRSNLLHKIPAPSGNHPHFCTEINPPIAMLE